MIEVITAGRSSTLSEFFDKSGVLEAETLPHNPFIVIFTEVDKNLENIKVWVKLAKSFKDLLILMQTDDLSVETPIMCQWPGKFRSDFFKMTLGDILSAAEAKGIIKSNA